MRVSRLILALVAITLMFGLCQLALTRDTGRSHAAQRGDVGREWSEAALHKVFEPMATDTRHWLEKTISNLRNAETNLQTTGTRAVQNIRGLRFRAEQLEGQLKAIEADAGRWCDDLPHQTNESPLHRLRKLRAAVRDLHVKMLEALQTPPSKSQRGTGAISGTITDSGTTLPIEGVSVHIYNSYGYWIANASTDASGYFVTNSTLYTGDFFARTSNSSGYINELYDNIPWNPSQPVTSGTAISVIDGNTTAGIDFALDAGGQITGTVTDSVSSLPIESVSVNFWTPTGDWIAEGFSDASGVYATLSGLPPGDYFARAFDEGGTRHLSELYDDIPCYFGCDVTTGTAITVVAGGANTTGIDFALDPGGIISGSVTDSESTLPIESVTVTLYDHTGDWICNAYSNASGYFVSPLGLPTGQFFALARDASGAHHISEIWDNLQCEGYCDATTGTAIGVTAGIETPNIDFALQLGGSISGTVTDNATSLPVEYGEIQFYDLAGTQIEYAYSDASGSYISSLGMFAGDHFALAAVGYSGYLQVLYDGIDCAYGCDETTGTPISVALGATTPGIDFSLLTGGTISGNVTAASSGLPIDDVSIDVYNNTGSWVADGWTNSAGEYMTSTVLTTGTHFVTTFNYQGYYDELFDDIDCSSGCDVTTGTPVSVTAGADTPGVDFALSRGGGISGTVTDDDTGFGVTNVQVQIFDDLGNFVTTGYTNSSGDYASFDPIDPGTYFAVAFGSSGDQYLIELYDDLPCALGCDATTGTPIVVMTGTVTTGVDFGLAVGGAVSGTVTDEATSLPIEYVDVYVYDDAGSNVASGSTDSNGSYTTSPGLPPGTYFTLTENWSGYLDELWDDLLCTSGCDPLTGSPIAISDGTVTPGINFALEFGTTISGMVREASGSPIDDSRVYAYDASGQYIGYGNVNNSGAYSIIGLPAGTYFLETYNWAGYLDELYDDLPCPDGNCHVVTGSPVVTAAGSDAVNIDFTLDPAGSISGTVTDAANGDPIDDSYIRLYDESGTHIKTSHSNSSGIYAITGLPAGTYRLESYNWSGYFDEVFDDIPCPGNICNFWLGDPVVVAAGGGVTNINFALDRGGQISGMVIDSATRMPVTDLRAIQEGEVWLFDAGGTFLDWTTIEGSGSYSFSNLTSGNYFVRTYNWEGYDDELFDNLPCENGCDVTTGTPVVVFVGSTTSGIDFALDGPLIFSDGFETGDSGGWS